MADKRSISEYYAELGKEVIETYEEFDFLRGAEVTILFLESSHKKKSHKKLVLGQCEKVAEKYKWGIPCDFTITIFNPNVQNMSEDQLKILLFHELMHVGIDEDGNGFIRAHDLEEFQRVVEKFGMNWASTEGRKQNDEDARDQD